MLAFAGKRIRRDGPCVSRTSIPHAAVMNVIPAAAFIAGPASQKVATTKDGWQELNWQ
jgi:hypothetical protein